MTVQQFYSNLEHPEKNYLFIIIRDGRVIIEHHTITEDELTEMDYFDAANIGSLEIGEACRTAAEAGTIVRVS